MATKKKRAYNSSVRRRQADETRSRIISAAQSLLFRKGFAGMTMDAVAREANVAVPTVYSWFGSKTAIVSAIIEHARFGQRYKDALKHTLDAVDPRDRLKNAARIAASVYLSEDEILDCLRGAEALAPELARFSADLESHRYEAQRIVIQGLARGGHLHDDLEITKARDIMWSLTSRDLYRLLVKERKWTVEEYQRWLGDTLLSTIVREA